MKKEDITKYRPFNAISLPNRTWPNKTIKTAPIWCSVDLRDGNQALINPMSITQKIALFQQLVKLGFKEIEVGFPAASETEYNFMRTLIEQDMIPDDVTVQVLTQAREHLIQKTCESLIGCKQSILHLYNSTSIAQRRVVFNKGPEEIKEIAVQGIKWIKKYLGPENQNVRLEYSPESYTGTELDVAIDICNAVIREWGGTDPIIINLPATVELSTPNVYADMIEWSSQHLIERERIILSLHTHNDRGTGVAATELGLLAGADRVEGTLFGNGERTGNVDIITLALNLATQGVDPLLEISDMNELITIYLECTNLPIHPRHPYAGELVFTAFSGSHQDAIKKGFAYQKEHNEQIWDVPYLPINPMDIGRTYEAIIRINSQSGKGGIAYIMETEFGCTLPKKMHPEFGQIVQKIADKTGEEVYSQTIWNAFKSAYLDIKTPLELDSFRITPIDQDTTDCEIVLRYNGDLQTITGRGNGPIAAAKNALEKCVPAFKILSYSEHSLEQGAQANAIAYLHVEQNNLTTFGAGIDTNISTASIKALFSALNRIMAQTQ